MIFRTEGLKKEEIGFQEELSFFYIAEDKKKGGGGY